VETKELFDVLKRKAFGFREVVEEQKDELGRVIKTKYKMHEPDFAAIKELWKYATSEEQFQDLEFMTNDEIIEMLRQVIKEYEDK